MATGLAHPEHVTGLSQAKRLAATPWKVPAIQGKVLLRGPSKYLLRLRQNYRPFTTILKRFTLLKPKLLLQAPAAVTHIGKTARVGGEWKRPPHSPAAHWPTPGEGVVLTRPFPMAAQGPRHFLRRVRRGGAQRSSGQKASGSTAVTCSRPTISPSLPPASTVIAFCSQFLLPSLAQHARTPPNPGRPGEVLAVQARGWAAGLVRWTQRVRAPPQTTGPGSLFLLQIVGLSGIQFPSASCILI